MTSNDATEPDIVQSRSRVLFVRVTPNELDAIHIKAKEQNVSVQAWAITQLGFGQRKHTQYQNRNRGRIHNGKRNIASIAQGDSQS
jgi:hypothetical protein